jgi:hypothetical protein
MCFVKRCSESALLKFCQCLNQRFVVALTFASGGVYALQHLPDRIHHAK